MEKRLVIADESFDIVMDELSREVGKILDNPPENREEREAFYAFFNSLKTLVEKRFQYWPEEDRKDLLATCGTWMNVGLLMGKSPRLLADILKKTKARTVIVPPIPPITGQDELRYLP
jgi:hypothetical protein